MAQLTLQANSEQIEMWKVAAELAGAQTPEEWLARLADQWTDRALDIPPAGKYYTVKDEPNRSDFLEALSVEIAGLRESDPTTATLMGQLQQYLQSGKKGIVLQPTQVNLIRKPLVKLRMARHRSGA